MYLYKIYGIIVLPEIKNYGNLKDVLEESKNNFNKGAFKTRNRKEILDIELEGNDLTFKLKSEYDLYSPGRSLKVFSGFILNSLRPNQEHIPFMRVAKIEVSKENKVEKDPVETILINIKTILNNNFDNLTKIKLIKSLLEEQTSDKDSEEEIT